MKRKSLSLLLALLLCLTACGGETADEPEAEPSPSPVVVATPEPTPEPVYEGPINPLTGEEISEEYVDNRPVAVMVNNLKAALPQQGIGQADIIYEVLAEGGITRMLAVYQSVDGVGEIGSVRSARPYYLELALGHDAVFLHAGGSEDAYTNITAWGVTALDCVRGPYEGTLFWRDADRMANNGYEHSVLTSGDKIMELFPTYTFRQVHEEDYVYEMTFVEDGTPENGIPATVISVPFSQYKTGVFTYDEESQKYFVEEYGEPHIDGNTGEQISVTNVIVIRTACNVIAGDDAGRLTVDLTSGGDGWYACGGEIIPILWSKSDRDSQFYYTTEDGEPIALGVGNSYVNIIQTNQAIVASAE